MLGVDFVEGLEVRNLSQKARRLDDMAHVCAGFLEHGLDIAAALLGLLLDRRGDDLALCRSLASGFFGKSEKAHRRGEERLSGKDAPLRGSSGGPADDERAAMDVLRMRGEFLPVHWRTDFPEAAAHGGFDVIIANPPWDVILPYRAEFFRDYIPDYGRLDTREAMKATATSLL